MAEAVGTIITEALGPAIAEFGAAVIFGGVTVNTVIGAAVILGEPVGGELLLGGKKDDIDHQDPAQA